MKSNSPAKPILVVLLGALLLAAGCRRSEPHRWQGYGEGEFVQVAAPLGGRLEHLAVSRGSRIEAGAPLFTLEQAAERAALREAESRLAQAQARLADARKGLRPTELAALEARLNQARAAASLSAADLARVTRLHDERVLADGDFDRSRLSHEANLKAVAELEAQLATGQLGARADTVAAAEAEGAAAQAAVDRAAWNVAQKTLAAPRAALVYDTLYREGEFVPAALPVVTLLPPENIKVRFFVPEADYATLKAGEPVRVTLSGRTEPLTARIAYLSPRPEYTPPVLYNRENRAKLVFMVEAALAPADARDLHPGQPVDVSPVN